MYMWFKSNKMVCREFKENTLTILLKIAEFAFESV